MRVTLSLIFCLLFGVVILGCKQRAPAPTSELSDWAVGIFKKMSKETGAIGWYKDRGGRSWTVEDERKFDEWITNVSPNIMIAWDIPTDCADAALALRFIYAYKNGLALKFGPLHSTYFYYDPITLLKLAVDKYGTGNLARISYPVSMWHLENYQGGSFYLSGGHTVPVKGVKDRYYFTSLNSREGRHVRKLHYSKFTPYHIAGDVFRRFYSTKRSGGMVFEDYETSFKAHPSAESDDYDWYDCIPKGAISDTIYHRLKEKITKDENEESHRIDKAYLTRNVRNFLASKKANPKYNQVALARDQVKCPHNVFWMKKYIEAGHVVPAEPKLSKEEFAQDVNKLCQLIQLRANAVHKGYQACVERSIPVTNFEKDCGGDKYAEYSTPLRDAELADYFYAYIYEPIEEKQFPVELFDTTCSIQLKPYDPNDKLTKEVYPIAHLDQNTPKAYPFWFSRVFYKFIGYLVDHHRFKIVTYDPTYTLEERWGCIKEDHQLSCLNQRDEDS